MKKLRGILVNTRKGIEIKRIEYNDYHDIAEALECSWITCVPRIIGGVLVDVYCDEEALLKTAREPALITRKKDTREIIEILYGNCFICKHNKKGEIVSLKHADYDPILLTQASISDKVRTYQVLQAEM